MIYFLSIAAAVLLIMFAIAWKQEVGGIYERWRAARRPDADPDDALAPSEYLVAVAWTTALVAFFVFAVVVVRAVATRQL